MNEWYRISEEDALDTPGVVVYRDRIKTNIDTLIESIDDVNRLRPHIKTHKSADVTRMLLDAGVRKFKCATLAEAEMLGAADAPDVLFAHQPVGPKLPLLRELTRRFPDTSYSTLVDNVTTAASLNAVFADGPPMPVFIDLNVGMDRTGVAPELALPLCRDVAALTHLVVKGLHAYDGHVRDADYGVRQARCDEIFARVVSLQEECERVSTKPLTIVAGGTPTYSIHRHRMNVECSPGTFIYWDKGYEDVLGEQHYLYAALVVSRVVSIPGEGLVCVDLGHKAIASESALEKRVSFLNAPGLKAVGHSEEHLVLEITDGAAYTVGDLLYGVPFHVCPTIALHDQATVVSDGRVVEHWHTTRHRSIEQQ